MTSTRWWMWCATGLACAQLGCGGVENDPSEDGATSSTGAGGNAGGGSGGAPGAAGSGAGPGAVTGSGTGGAPVDCPAQQPGPGDSCTQPDAQCAYPYDGYQCGTQWVATWSCQQGTWALVDDACAEPDWCLSDTPPEDGAPCQVESYCEHNEDWLCVNGASWTYACIETDAGHVWSVEYWDGCPCASISTPEECANGAGPNACVWVEPGCGDNPAPASCQDAALQIDGTCDDIYCERGNGHTCAVQSVHPCPDGSCGSCDVQAPVCVPLNEP